MCNITRRMAIGFSIAHIIWLVGCMAFELLLLPSLLIFTLVYFIALLIVTIIGLDGAAERSNITLIVFFCVGGLSFCWRVARIVHFVKAIEILASVHDYNYRGWMVLSIVLIVFDLTIFGMLMAVQCNVRKQSAAIGLSIAQIIFMVFCAAFELLMTPIWFIWILVPFTIYIVVTSVGLCGASQRSPTTIVVFLIFAGMGLLGRVGRIVQCVLLIIYIKARDAKISGIVYDKLGWTTEDAWVALNIVFILIDITLLAILMGVQIAAHQQIKQEQMRTCYGPGSTPTYGYNAAPAYGYGPAPAYGYGPAPAYGYGPAPAYGTGMAPAVPQATAPTTASKAAEATTVPQATVPQATVPAAVTESTQSTTSLAK